MLRFVALVWNNRDREADSYAGTLAAQISHKFSKWNTILHRSTLRVLVPDDAYSEQQTIRTLDGNGVILGTLFRNLRTGGDSPDPRITSISNSTSKEITETHFRNLVNDYWGSYVSIFYDPRMAKSYIFRAPLGFVNCFFVNSNKVRIYFSRTEDVIGLLSQRFEPNWQYIATRLVSDTPRRHETSVVGILSLTQGECATHELESIAHHQVWHPSLVAQSDPILNSDEAIKDLRHAAIVSVRSWAAAHPRLLVRLSGGLDSSIVLGCLHKKDTEGDAFCFNEYSIGSDSDERKFARLVAELAQRPLIEQERRTGLRWELTSTASRTAVFSHELLNLTTAPRATEIAKSLNATAVFTGNGGDELFYRDPALSVISECFQVLGLDYRLPSLLLSVAQMERLSIWKVIGDSVTEILQRSHKPWKKPLDTLLKHPSKKMLNSDFIKGLISKDYLPHPWFEQNEYLPKAKYYQVSGLICIPYESPLEQYGDPEVIHPLMSQPLVEICLRIPAFIHIGAGFDRAIARRAFSGLVPQEILTRTTKGRIREHTQDIITANAEMLRHTILDGELVRHGVLNKSLLDASLADAPTVGVGFEDIVDYVSIELWLKAWRNAFVHESRERLVAG